MYFEMFLHLVLFTIKDKKSFQKSNKNSKINETKMFKKCSKAYYYHYLPFQISAIMNGLPHFSGLRFSCNF